MRSGCVVCDWASRLRKNIVACRELNGSQAVDNRGRSRRMLEKARLLTCSTPARQDAPFRGQGGSERRGRRYRPHCVWAVRPLNGSWRTEKPIPCFRHPRGSLRYVEPLSAARTKLTDFFSILLLEVQGVWSRPKLGLPMMPVLSSSSFYGTQIR